MGKTKTPVTAPPNFISGWVDFSIYEFCRIVARNGEIPKQMTWTLISCLDSCPNVLSLVEQSQHLRLLKQQDYRPIGSAIAIKTQILLKLDQEERIFFGFDEVWFGGEPHLSQPNPSDGSQGSDSSHPEQGQPFYPAFGLFGTDRLAAPQDHNGGWLEGKAEPQTQQLTCPVLLPPDRLSIREKDAVVKQFMQVFQLSCGLGDGIGMNYLVNQSSSRIMAYLLQAHEQSQALEEEAAR